jgi:hypothetical protein
MEKNVARLRDVVGGKSQCCVAAGRLVAPFWLFETVSDFFNVTLIFLELVKNFLHEISPCAMLGGDSSHFIDKVLIGDGAFNCFLSKENGGKKGDKAYAYISCILLDC